MNVTITRHILFFCLLLQSTLLFSQTKTISGKVTGSNGESLPGVNILIKGTNNGTVTDFNGQYSIILTGENDVLMFSYIGYQSVEFSITNTSSFDVQMEEDMNVLNELVITGIRASQMRASEVKREAATVVEAITPEDIGNFSDINVADALQRVPGVQIERNVDGSSGDRVSIRGIGPQFVTVTMNGRTPISAGNEGRSDMRKFNLNMIPSEIINGATVYKATESRLISSGIGGSIDFQTIRPLDLKYKKNKKYFGVVSYRGSSNSKIDELDFSPRFSGSFGGKIRKNLAVYASAMYRKEKFYREEAALRGYRELDLKEDSNGDGVFNENDGDRLYKDVMVPTVINNTQMNDEREQLAISSAIQWKPTENLDIVADYFMTKLNANSDRQMMQMLLAPGGANGLLGANNFFQPGSILFNKNYLNHIDAAGASKSRAILRNRNQFFDNHTTNNMAGLNARYTPTENLKVNVDLSYSDLNYFQNLTQPVSQLNLNTYSQSDINVNWRGDYPNYNVPDEFYDASNYDLLNTPIKNIRTEGINYAGMVDLDYKVNDKINLLVGSRLAVTDFESREGGLLINDYTDEQKDEYSKMMSEGRLIKNNFFDGKTGLNNWVYTPGQEILGLTPNRSALDGGSIFDFNTPLRDVVSEEGNMSLASARSYGSQEKTFSAYAQMNAKTKLFNIPIALNVGVRAVHTNNISRGFTGVMQTDPVSGGREIVDGALYHETEFSDWQFLPSLNANLRLSNRINYRIGITKAASRPRFKDLIPSNDIQYLNPNSEIFNPESEEYIENLAESTHRGTVIAGNPELKPYTSWNIDNTFEYYTNKNGAFVVSAFYKHIKNFIGTETLTDQQYPGEEVYGISLPAGQENLLFDITKPINLTDANIYGLEVGFNQHFTFLPAMFNGFGLQANYTYLHSQFDDAVGDAINGFPGSSPHNFNSVLYYEKYGFTIRFTAAYRSNYLSNLGGVGSTRADESHYTEGGVRYSFNAMYRVYKGLQLSVGGINITGTDTRRYLADDPNNFSAYYNQNPVWNFSIRYKL
ncbi:TonB-dependent receptor [Flammeovirga pacifica]|uniref:Uncharacterized protein n=1 Tax=Flammeovirga pacifica TaxID=915059 RepID=A0A1S1YUT0_FLAPC|nr:TonB-dependent receptor [Flammeovirga pacifica]OHX64565.1 hypothetical protein NH26_23625 [Flammeovirga pacifica]